MRIIITVHSYFPLKSGVQAVTGYQAEELVKRGHDVTVITPGAENDILEELHNGVKIIRIKGIAVHHTFYLGNKKEYQELVLEKTKNADVLMNVCTQTATTDWVFPILDLISCKKILFIHGMYDSSWSKENLKSIQAFCHKIWNNVRWGIYYKTQGRYFDKYDDIIQLHKFDSANLYFQKHYGIECSIVENAADSDFFMEDYRDTLDLPEKYAICVANYMDRKNQKFVLKSFYKTNIQSEFELIFIGSSNNDYYKQLLQMNEDCKKLYGKRPVRFLYNVPREAIAEYVKRATLYLLGSKWEAYPISIIEAMAAGVPYITTDVGCVRFLPGGIIVKTEDEMAYWLDLLEQNEESRHHLGAMGKTYAKKNLSISSRVTQLENIILSLFD